MKTLVVNQNVIVSIFAVLMLIYGVQSISYGQLDAPTVSAGETARYLTVSFSGVCDEKYNAYQVQLRRKSPQGEWITKCTTVFKTDTSIVFIFILGGDCVMAGVVFGDLEPGVTYEARYRDTNLPECVENPLSPGPWSAIGEGTTHLVAPPRVEFVDANLAREVRRKSGLSTGGGHIDLLKIPQASLAKLTKLESDDKEITDLTGLEHAIRLIDLDLSDNQISDITPLAQLTQLTELELDRNQIGDINPLVQLTQLTRLWLWDNQIRDISPVIGLPNLRSLFLSSNQISDVTPLTTFASLESLRIILLSGNPIANVSPVRKLKRENPNLRIAIDIPVILTDPGGEPDLYVIADGSILQLNLNEINAEKITPESLRTYDVAIDAISDKIYWATRDDIRRANLDGTHVQVVVPGLDEPENIALDVSDGKVYWTIERGDRIQRSNLDGTSVQDVITGLYRPYGIALDVPSSKIYWMEEDDHRIRQANLDGTNIQDVVTGLDEPEDITIDVLGGKIYWTENGGRQIQRLNLDGSDFHIIVPDLDGPRGITLDVRGGKIYWTDYFNNGIWRANLDGSDVHVVTIGVSSPTAIAVHSSLHTTEPTVLKEDVNGDGTVNIQDVVLTASNLGETGQNAADVNGDGSVNIQDLVLVAGALGTSAAAPSLHPQALEMITTAEVKQWLSAAQQLGLTDITSQRGILFLQQLLMVLTPKETALLPNYPNPFNPETWIPYHLAKDADVILHIYAVNGQLVRTLTLGHQPAGMYQSRSRAAYWDGKNAFDEPVASGVYFYTLSTESTRDSVTAGDFTATRKMLICK